MTQKIRSKVTFGLVSYRIWPCLTFQATLKRPDIFSERQCCIKLKHFPYRKIPIFERIPRYTVHTVYIRLESWNEYLSSANIIPLWPLVAFTRAISFKYNLWLFNILWFSCQNDIKRWNKSYNTISVVERASVPSGKPQLFDYRCIHRRKVNIEIFDLIFTNVKTSIRRSFTVQFTSHATRSHFSSSVQLSCFRRRGAHPFHQ